MKPLKLVAIVLAAYVGIVVAFESFLGAVQPRPESTIVITTFDKEGAAQDRVVTPVREHDRLYVSANHWPRSWYKRALENPDVEVASGGEKKPYRAVPVSPEENDRLTVAHAHSFAFRFVTGFAPRRFLRLDPR